MQLNLLDLEPVEDVAAPLPVAQSSRDHLAEWHEVKSTHYLKLMNRFINGNLPNHIKTHEIQRLQQLRQNLQ